MSLNIGIAAMADRSIEVGSKYGKEAEAECYARASYYSMQGDIVTAEQWRKLRAHVAV